jgi:hypothetical protein
VLRHGVLAEHPGRYRVRKVDALKPEETLPHEPGLRGMPRPFRAVFLNYLLDCLPAAALQWEGEQVQQLHVRTCVGRNVNLADYTDLSPQQLRERAKSTDPRAREELLEVYGLFAAEARCAYEKALSVNAADVRARYNLAWAHTREKEYPAALQRIAEALALDKTSEYRDRLLQKQQEVVARQTQRHQQEYLLLINLVSKYAKQDKDNPADARPLSEHQN